MTVRGSRENVIEDRLFVEGPMTDRWKAQVYAAMQFLSGQCDGAKTLDGVGFTGTDAKLGKLMAQLPAGAWSDEMYVGAWRMLHKYAETQLKAGGYDYKSWGSPEGHGVRSMAEVRAVTVEGGFFVLTYGYDPQLVEAIKRLPRRSFNRDTRQWMVPLADWRNVHEFARRWGFVLAPEAAAVDDEAVRARRATAVKKPTVTIGVVDEVGGELVIRSEYDPRLTMEIKSLPNRRFVAETKAWHVPAYLVRPVREIAERYGLELTARAQAVPDRDPDEVPVSVAPDPDEPSTLLVRFPYRPELTAVMRGIDEARWDKTARGWRIGVEQAEELIAKLDGSKVDLGVSGTEVMKAAREYVERVKASRALDAELEIPGLRGELYPFQRAGVAYALEVRRCLICDEMGLGKTPQGLAVIEAAQAYPAVVLVPASLKLNWQREARKWLPKGRHVQVVGGTKGRKFGFVKPDVLIVNYDVAYAWVDAVRDLKPMAVVADESHLIKNPKAQRTEAAIEMARMVPPEGVVLALTGTPVVNRRAEMASQLDFLGRLKEFGGAKKVAEDADLARRLRGRCMVRRVKKAVAPELPARQHAPVLVEGDVALMREYDRAEREFFVWLREWAMAKAKEAGLENPESAAFEAVIRARAGEQLAKIGHLRRLAGRAKLPVCKEWVREFLAQRDEQGKGKKLILFGQHLDVLKELAATFDAPLIIGETPKEERQKTVDRFQEDDSVRLVVVGIAVGGVGLTLTAASDVLFVEQAWSPAIHDQCIDRCYGRLNDMHGAVGWYLIADGTIDEWMLELIEEKRAECSDATEGDVSTDESDKTSVYGDLLWRMTKKAVS